MAAIHVHVESLADAVGLQEMASDPAFANAIWIVYLDAVDTVRSAPGVLRIVNGIRHARPPLRLRSMSVRRIRALRSAAIIAVLLNGIRSVLGVLLSEPANRPLYALVRDLARDAKQTSNALPPASRRDVKRVANRVRRVAQAGLRSGGIPRRDARRFLRDAARLVRGLQQARLPLRVADH